ncbi:sulfultransferase [Corynebacterium phocae]|uniref:Sulfultransferase n=1 Tax=Corynebacterium phocae TaxID=161895 RepID=A0A1L7D5Q7_9CORY|nr:sulfurtransferase [Corynebacterium phocae]APT93333.1 sulfultransferase [Corynebacterium phocae]KAA8721665.1 sulfurtransferase [Corynebacterium phocae]
MSILVSPSELNNLIHTGKRFTLLASVWEPGPAGSYGLFSSLHIPTARFCDAAAALAGIPGSQFGRNPLPDPANLQKWFQRWGLEDDRPVIVYDEGRGLMAGRAWWILRWAGIKDVSILDGGFQNWREQGYPTLAGPGNIAVESDSQVRPGSLPTATIEEVKAHEGLLIDTREPNRFAGFRENLDLKAGHIPGAINVPERAFHKPDGTWKSKKEICDAFVKAGANEENLKDAIIYSGSGNHSGLAIAAMEWAGLPVPRHFVGGWSQWSANPKNPVERGL